ncbi:sulfite exporter TauE/SafE family protein [Actinotalea sp.]|uniref:sulfite exporter TauE/SafE family protein n=1 Tax=Actinotalea sp. TaxID=1872145 RepID=UPI0035645328
MDPLQILAIAVAGTLAGAVNTIVGAGTLLTFPLLVALGVSPLTANVSNTVGLVPGAVTGAWGYRRELAGHWGTVARMAALSALGGAIGGSLVLVADPDTFTAVVPWLLVLAAGLAAAQPRVAAWVRRRAGAEVQSHAGSSTRPLGIGLALGIAATGIYGGYFGAAQGVILISLLGIGWSSDLHRANGAKNVLAGTANVVSAAVFIAGGTVDWTIAGLIAVGSALGGVLGARIGRRIPAVGLRALIVTVALIAAAALWFG